MNTTEKIENIQNPTPDQIIQYGIVPTLHGAAARELRAATGRVKAWLKDYLK